MKNFLKVAGYILVGFLVLLYVSFLFVLPRKIDLNVYKPEIQKLVTENTGLNINFDRVDIITTPWLEAGLKTKNIKVTLPDNSILFSADSFKGKVFLPSLLWLTVRVSCAEVESPHLNVEILNGEKFKVAKVYEDLVNKRRQQRRLNPPKTSNETEEFPFDISNIKLNIPVVKLMDYKAVIDDTASAHKLTLKGKELKLGYFNGKNVKLKTEAEFYSDKDKNITANLDIDTFLPPFGAVQKEEEDNEAVFALPFINPVSAYRDYTLKSNINSKLKIRQNKKDNKLRMNGFVDIEGTTLTMSGLQLPESYFRFNAKGTTADIDTYIYLTDSEYINLAGNFDYGKEPYLDLSMKSPKVHFSNVLKIARAYLDTIHIRNDIENMTASGFLLSNANIKTDFVDIISDGKIIIREGNVSDKNTGLLFNDINANLFFDDNILQVLDTHVLINNHPLNISGKVDSNSIANFHIKGDKIPLPGLYAAFAPREVKQSYNLKSGVLTLDSKVTGEIKDIAAIFKADLENFVLNDRTGNFILSNKRSHFGVANYAGVIRGKLKNTGFNLYLPKTGSIIKDDFLIVNIDNKSIIAKPSIVKINRNSSVKFYGNVKKYLSDPVVKLFATGNLASTDIAYLLGKETIPYFEIKGQIPLRGEFSSKGKNMKFTAQLKADNSNYITPIKLDELTGKQTIIQVMAEKRNDTLKINKTGLYVRKPDMKFSHDLASNLNGAKEIVSVRAMISNLSINPFINLLKVSIPRSLDGTICIFKKSRFNIGGQLFAFGKPTAPHINGNFNIRNITIPELYTTARQIVINLGSKDIDITINDVDSNGSDFNLGIQTTWNLIPKMILSEVRVSSNFINVDKLMKVSNAAVKTLSPSNSSVSAKKSDIPVVIQRGNVRLRRIKSGNIIANNTTGKISLYNNVFYLNKLKTYPLGGNVYGDISMNLLTTELNAKVHGNNFDIEKVLLDIMQMKDTLSGKLNFVADVSLRGAKITEQMKTLKGFVDFTVKDGQLGPFGKFENFLMAENIRENAFFSSAVGSIITNLVTIDTSHFNDLYGHIIFSDGVADIAPIKSQGDVMSMYIAGKVNLLDNSAEMKIRGKLASAFSDKLGPLANINPINLVKNTPGLNAVAVKAFALFCEEVSEEEMNALPHLGKGKTDENATKFQIVLRGDTRKPLKMIRSFKWLALNSEIQSAQNFVDTIPTPELGEENLSVEELIKLREQQAAAAAQGKSIESEEQKNKTFIEKIKEKLKK